MTIQEFQKRTNFKPTEMYFNEVILPEYMSTDMDKDTFCKCWINSGGKQKSYDYLLNQLIEQIKNTEKYIKAFEEKTKAYDELWSIKNKLLKELNNLKS